jgi:nitrite reductase/ring-hydroxylating ferredoxin subunit
MDENARRARALVQRIGGDERIDRAAGPLSSIARALTQRDDVKRALSGSWLGHRVHPLLTDIPIGAWSSAAVLDLLGGRRSRRGARLLVGAGIVATLPTAATGLSDWNDTYGDEKRIGVVHAAANVTALLLQVQSWRARGKGHHARAVVLSGAALGALSVGGYLGGHLVFAERVGVDVEVPVADLDEWRPVCPLDDLGEDEPRGVEVDGARVAIVRRGDTVHAMAAVCSHAGGPLDEGCVERGALQCPWHRSEFALVDGSVVRGPATSPQPVYDARVRDGMVELRGPQPIDLTADASRFTFAGNG